MQINQICKQTIIGTENMKKNIFEFWGNEIPAEMVKDNVKEYLSKYSEEPPSVKDVWKEMDRVWDELALSNDSSLLSQPIAEYYSHPVWVLNGFFSAADAESSRHRNAIVNCISSLQGKKLADYGGGFCELAIRIALKIPDSKIDVIEPFPSAIGRFRASKYSNISITSKLDRNYDVVIAQDVLEHIEDPIGLIVKLSESIKPDGYIIFANCFYPVIKCHLPSTFHLRHTFSWVVKAAGLELIESVSGAKHAQIFRKSGDVNLPELRKRERYSKAIGWILNLLLDKLRTLLRPTKIFEK